MGLEHECWKSGRRWWSPWPWFAACAALILVYLPAMSLGPVAEDLQWALKGAATPLHPAGLLAPFHQHLRPAGNVAFAAMVAVFGHNWVGYRVVVLALVIVLAAVAYRFLHQTLLVPPIGAGLVVALWLISPLTDEVLFVTNQLKQVLLGVAVLGVLLLRGRPPTPWRRLAIVMGAVTAAMTKEEWVILPALVLAQDTLLLDVPWRRAVRRVVPWALAVVGYLAAYWALVGFQAEWFYSRGATRTMAKGVATLAAFLHLMPPVPWEFTPSLAERPLAVGLAVALAVALAAFAVARRQRLALFSLLAGLAAALPTLPGGGQAGRYMLLPWLFFLAASVIALREVASLLRAGRALEVPLVVLALLLLVGDAVLVRRDAEDWLRFAALGRAVEAESAPLLARARAGCALVVVRGDDGGALRRLLESPRGQLKLYFPRPDDPYGAVSLSALLSWQTYREGFVLERVKTLPEGQAAAAFAHENGGFRPVGGPEGGLSGARAPLGGSRTPVILVPRPWAGFDPAAFP